MNFNGTVKVKTLFVGSKSEGRYCFLELPDETEYRLCREGVLDTNDEFILNFEDKSVSVEGEASGKWIIVEKINCNSELIENESIVIEK